MTRHSLVPIETITHAVLRLRGHNVLLDADLPALYEVETKALVRAVKRNVERFPEDFMFQLSQKEFDELRSQLGASSSWGGRRYRPMPSRSREWRCSRACCEAAARCS